MVDVTRVAESLRQRCTTMIGKGYPHMSTWNIQSLHSELCPAAPAGDCAPAAAEAPAAGPRGQRADILRRPHSPHQPQVAVVAIQRRHQRPSTGLPRAPGVPS